MRSFLGIMRFHGDMNSFVSSFQEFVDDAANRYSCCDAAGDPAALDDSRNVQTLTETREGGDAYIGVASYLTFPH